MTKNVTFILLTALSLAFRKPNSQVKDADPAKPTIVLVHGLWADGSSWSKVIPLLTQKGYNVISVQNPTTSIEDDVVATKRAIELAKGDVVLVGHSWGGFVITEAGDNPKVKCLVYVNAYAPEKGETVPTLSAKAVPTKLSDFLVPLNGFISLTEEGVKNAFANDLPEGEQKLIFTVQQPASVNVFKAVGNNAAWKSKPSWYIISSEDKTISPELERFMADRAKSKTTVLKANHVSMLSKPNEVVAVIEDAATQSSQH